MIWEYSWDGATGALMSEFMALGNHRKSIRAEVAEVSDRVRQVELDALRTNRELAHGNLSPDALVVLISAIRNSSTSRIGVQTAHRELVDAVERYLDSVEPPGIEPVTKIVLTANAGSDNAELRETNA